MASGMKIPLAFFYRTSGVPVYIMGLSILMYPFFPLGYNLPISKPGEIPMSEKISTEMAQGQ